MRVFFSADCNTTEIRSIMIFIGPHSQQQFTATLFQGILLNIVLYTRVIFQAFLSLQDNLSYCVCFSDMLIPWAAQKFTDYNSNLHPSCQTFNENPLSTSNRQTSGSGAPPPSPTLYLAFPIFLQVPYTFSEMTLSKRQQSAVTNSPSVSLEVTCPITILWN